MTSWYVKYIIAVVLRIMYIMLYYAAGCQSRFAIRTGRASRSGKVSSLIRRLLLSTDRYYWMGTIVSDPGTALERSLLEETVVSAPVMGSRALTSSMPGGPLYSPPGT
jgi:hypothetical protein